VVVANTTMQKSKTFRRGMIPPQTGFSYFRRSANLEAA